MSQKQPPRVQLNFEPDYDPPETSGANQNMDLAELSLDSDEDNYAEDMMPEIVGKQKINERDIFADLPTVDADDDIDTESVVDPTPKSASAKPASKPVKEPKAKKPRKPMSEEHKAKLAFAREKAMAVRKAKAEEKKKMKALENEEKELLKTQKVKRVAKLKKQVEEESDEADKEPKEVKSLTTNISNITKKDLEDAQFEAIVKYETLRKQRKAEKKQQQAIEQSKKELLNKLQPQRQYQYRDGSNPWDLCY